MAAELKVGDNLPSDVVFSYIPYTPESSEITACGIPVNYEAGKGMFTALYQLLFPCIAARYLSVQLFNTTRKEDM